jgi:hypothetical protein
MMKWQILWVYHPVAMGLLLLILRPQPQLHPVTVLHLILERHHHQHPPTILMTLDTIDMTILLLILTTVIEATTVLSVLPEHVSTDENI